MNRFKRLLFIFCASQLFYSASLAQVADNIIWQKSLGGTGYDIPSSIQETFDKGFIIMGAVDFGDGDVTGWHEGKSGLYNTQDIWVIKLDSNGNVQWSKCYGGSGNEFPGNIIQTRDSGFIFCGSTDSNDGDVSGNHGAGDVWIVKLEKNGNILWKKCYGGSNNDGAKTIKQLKKGYIIGAQSNSNNGNVTNNFGSSDFWIIKIDEVGNILWEKNYGGSNTEFYSSIEITLDEGYIISGCTFSNDENAYGNQYTNGNVWIVRIDSIGNLKWQKTYGGTCNDGTPFYTQVYKTGYIIAGSTCSNNGDVSNNHGKYDIWIFFIDSIGKILQEKCYGGSDFDGAVSIRKTWDNGFIIAGDTYSNDGDVTGLHKTLTTYNDSWVIKIDSSGNLKGEQCFGGIWHESARDIVQTSDSNFVMVSLSESNDGDVIYHHGTPPFGQDIWAVKFSVPTGLPDGITKAKNFSNKILIYPNPSSTQITILNNSNTEGKLFISDILGRTCFSAIYKPQEKLQIDISQFAKGVCFVKSEQQEYSLIQKLIVQ